MKLFSLFCLLCLAQGAASFLTAGFFHQLVGFSGRSCAICWDTLPIEIPLPYQMELWELVNEEHEEKHGTSLKETHRSELKRQDM